MRVLILRCTYVMETAKKRFRIFFIQPSHKNRLRLSCQSQLFRNLYDGHSGKQLETKLSHKACYIFRTVNYPFNLIQFFPPLRCCFSLFKRLLLPLDITVIHLATETELVTKFRDFYGSRMQQ